MKHPMIDAVVFDLWQTLIYSPCPPWKDERVLREFSAQELGGFYQYIGETAQRRRYPSSDAYFSDVLPKTGKPADSEPCRYLRGLMEREIGVTVAYSDAVPALTDLRQRGYKMALLSNLSWPYAAPIERLGLAQHFDTVRLSCDDGLVKPEKEFFLKACAELGVSPERSLMVGDNLKLDIEGARNAGLMAAWLDRENAPGTLPPGASRITSLEPLKDL